MRKKRALFITLLVFILILTAVVSAGLWNGSGTLIDLIAGQFPAEPRSLDPAVSANGSTANSYTVSAAVDPARPIAQVSPNYLSFSIDASQVTGGKWWNPSAQSAEMGSGTVHAPVFDFNRPQLDQLTRALGPAYLRIGGSESDKVYYDLSAAGTEPTTPPSGYQSVLTRGQWDALNAFARRSNLDVVFTLNAGPSSRTSSHAWDPANAAALIAYTHQQNYPVRVWELGNELNIFWFVFGFKAQISTGQYQQDLQTARSLIQQSMPQARLGGEGSAVWPVLGEPLSLFYGYLPGYLKQSGGLVDQVSWHYYPQQSRRGPIASRRASPARLLDPKALDEAALWADRMRAWRDQYAPGKPIWLGETGNAQFGGEPGLSDSYLGGLWWLDELGLLATKDTQVVVRQTLSGMNYGMIDDATVSPRPDYWNSLLWKRLMGTEVYPVSVSGENASHLRAYAQSAPSSTDGSVTLLLINIDPQREARVQVGGMGDRPVKRYDVTSDNIFGQQVMVNGQALRVGPDGSLPDLTALAQPVSMPAEITVHPLSYTFIQLQP
jgi:heparanase 1